MRTDNPPDRVIRIIADMIRGGRLLTCLDVQRRTFQRSISRHSNNHHVAHRLQRRIFCSSRIMKIPFNTESDGTSHTIKSQYFKMGKANVLDISFDGANFKATGVIVIYE